MKKERRKMDVIHFCKDILDHTIKEIKFLWNFRYVVIIILIILFAAYIINSFHLQLIKHTPNGINDTFM
jgi:hypothetical protein